MAQRVPITVLRHGIPLINQCQTSSVLLITVFSCASERLLVLVFVEDKNSIYVWGAAFIDCMSLTTHDRSYLCLRICSKLDTKDWSILTIQSLKVRWQKANSPRLLSKSSSPVGTQHPVIVQSHCSLTVTIAPITITAIVMPTFSPRDFLATIAGFFAGWWVLFCIKDQYLCCPFTVSEISMQANIEVDF